MNGKEIVTNDEITKEAKKWLASFTNEELSRKIDEVEEKFIAELEKIRDLEWLESKDGEKNKRKDNFLNIECTLTNKEDKRKFKWSLSNETVNLQTVFEIDALRDVKEVPRAA